jgi:uncharacterized protein (DUF4415 family)
VAEIEFDPNKDESNLRKHGISLARASDFRPIAVLEDTRKNYGETRYRAFGFIDEKPYALAFTVRGSTAAKKFVLSACVLPPRRRLRIMTSRKRADPDNPEWTAEDFALAKKPEEALAADVLSVFKRRGPQRAPTKIPVSIRLSPDVVTYFKKQGPRWQSRIDDTLKKVVSRGLRAKKSKRRLVPKRPSETSLAKRKRA